MLPEMVLLQKTGLTGLKNKLNPNTTSGFCYSYTWYVIYLKGRGREIEPVRANSSNTQEEDLVTPEGKGRTLDSTGPMQKNIIYHYPVCPVSMLLCMVSVKTREG